MNQKQLIGTAFEYAHISNLSAGVINDLDKLISLMTMYKRPATEIKQMSDMRLLLTEYHYTYTSAGLENLLSL
jgi:hypothetical protein